MGQAPMTGKDMAEALSNFANGCSRKDIEEFAEHLTTRVHRTLQQKCMGLFIACVERWAEDKYGHDMRNEATVVLCKKIVAGTGDKYDRILPYI
jgi:hypothetical protein